MLISTRTIQLALTQPVRVGDTVEFEDAWGYVERITFTYVTIRTWDERRKIIPLQYFMSHPLENLTVTNASLIKPNLGRLSHGCRAGT